MKKLTKIFALICAIICLASVTTACSKEDYTYWQTDRKVAGETVLAYTAEISFGSSNVKVNEIWINVSNIDFDPASKQVPVTIELKKKTSSTSNAEVLDRTITSEQLKKAKDGWIQIYITEDGKAPIECNVATLKIVNKMRVNEICFINSNGKLINTTFTKAGVVAGNSSNLYTKEQLENLTAGYVYDEKGNYAFNLIDEQGKFPLEYIQTPVQD